MDTLIDKSGCICVISFRNATLSTEVDVSNSLHRAVSAYSLISKSERTRTSLNRSLDLLTMTSGSASKEISFF